MAIMPEGGCEFSICDPENAFDVEVDSIHPCALEATANEYAREVRSWALKFGLFPGQGVWYAWKPRAAPSPIAPADLAQISSEVRQWRVKRYQGLPI
jgi:hypothetical protein